MKSATKKRRTKKQPLSPLTGADLAAAVSRMIRLKERGAKLYFDAGRLAERVQISLQPGESLIIEAKRGRKTFRQRVTMIDPFLDQDTAQPVKQWKHVPVDRFSFDVEEIPADELPAVMTQIAAEAATNA